MAQDIDFSDLEKQYHVQLDTTYDNYIVVDHLPIVDDAKEEKLVKVIRKIFKNIGEIKDLYMPKDLETGKSQG